MGLDSEKRKPEREKGRKRKKRGQGIPSHVYFSQREIGSIHVQSKRIRAVSSGSVRCYDTVGRR